MICRGPFQFLQQSVIQEFLGETLQYSTGRKIKLGERPRESNEGQYLEADQASSSLAAVRSVSC